jgi:hypothetical protein
MKTKAKLPVFLDPHEFIEDDWADFWDERGSGAVRHHERVYEFARRALAGRSSAAREMALLLATYCLLYQLYDEDTEAHCEWYCDQGRRLHAAMGEVWPHLTTEYQTAVRKMFREAQAALTTKGGTKAPADGPRPASRVA